MHRAALLAVLLGVLALAPASARATVSLLQVGSFTQPTYAIGAPGDPSRLYVTEKGGRIAVVHDGVPSTFLDLTSRVKSSGNEEGLLSLAFAPDYATSGTFYVYYTAPPPPPATGEVDLVISAFHATDADHADPASERMVLTIPHRLFGNHDGGQLQTGPDGMLWLGTGDGGDHDDTLGNAQRLDPATDDAAAEHDARLGKLLRIDPRPGAGCEGRCTIPADNPGLPQPEVWAYGLRNPWRFSFDRVTGDLAIADVGQAVWEEVDFAPAPGLGRGANYGWNTYEGAHPRGTSNPPGPAPGVTMPVLEKAHFAPDSFSSIAGGYVVRDAALPDLLGRYLYADTYQGEIRAVTLAPGGATADAGTGLRVSTLVSFGEDACGRVYAVSLDGPVYRLAQSGDCRPAGPVETPPAPASPAADTTPPALRVRAPARQRPWRSGVLRLAVSCDEICDVTARGRLAPGGLRTGVARASLAEHATATLRLRVSASARRRLLRALRGGRRVSARFTVLARDRAGNARTVGARARLVRR